MNERILLVDDDPVVCFTVEVIFRKTNIEVLSAHSGTEALRCLESGFKGLILMDVMMPGMDGWETIEAIVDKGLMEGNIICMLTAVDSPSPKLEKLKEHVLEYIRKPFHPNDLVAAVAQYLQLVPQELGT
ncbi:MAG: response regulator [Phycisphaerae bacterium]|jgi:CheY-like chemotaxis protein|nr:response regulator [Phycisphaerae bacterium]